MILDVAIVVVFLLAAYGGYKAGLLSSILNIFKWVLAGVFASLLTSPTKTFLMKNTSIYDNLIPKEDVSTFTPENSARFIVEPISQIIFSALVFFVLFMIFSIILSLFAKRLHPTGRGPLSLTNKLMGLLFGSIEGIIGICILVSVMLPLADIFFHSFAPILKSNLESSHIAKYIYDSKPLWTLSAYLIR